MAGINFQQLMGLVSMLGGNNAANQATPAGAVTAVQDATGQAPGQAPGAAQAPQNSTTPAANISPESQAILAGAKSPSPAAQAAAFQESRILEGQNPALVHQGLQQSTQATQPIQNSPGMAPQPTQSALGGGNFSQEQVTAGQQGAQTASEKGLWDKIGQTLSGEGLTGEALKDWRRNMGLATALGLAGGAIGGNSIGGRIGEGAYQLGAGALASKNAEQQQENQNNFMQAAFNAMIGKQPGAVASATPTTASGQGAAPAPTNTPMPQSGSALASPTTTTAVSDINQTLNATMKRLHDLTSIG